MKNDRKFAEAIKQSKPDAPVGLVGAHLNEDVKGTGPDIGDEARMHLLQIAASDDQRKPVGAWESLGSGIKSLVSGPAQNGGVIG